MSAIDLALLAIIAVFGVLGFFFGFVHTLGSLLGTLLGAYVAGRYYEPLANWIISLTGWGENISKVAVFMVAFILINRAVGFVFWFIDRTLSLVTRLPFVASINRILGAILGALEGFITIGLVVYFASKFPIGAPVMAALGASRVVPGAVAIAAVLLPLLPDALRLLKSTLENVEQVLQS